MKDRFRSLGTLGLAIAVAAGCGSERARSSYKDRITYIDIDKGVTLTCYSDRTKAVVSKQNPTNIVISLKNGFCPDENVN